MNNKIRNYKSILEIKIRRIKIIMADRFPRFWAVIRKTKWSIILPIRRAKALLRAKYSRLHVDPYEIFLISPYEIKKSIYRQIEGVPNTAFAYGTIKAGNWDSAALPIEEEEFIRAAKARFIEGKEWQSTIYYKEALDIMAKGKIIYQCSNKEDFENHLRSFDKLFESIKKDGYKAQSELRGHTIKEHIDDEIAVHIDRNGHYIFCNGMHRFAIALILNIKYIPVMVCIRHTEWQSLINEIIAYAKKNNGYVYQPLTHPDLRNIPSAHGEKRFKIIRENLPQSQGTLLDIGAHWGYFCHLFEEIGFDCYAVESAQEHIFFLNKLKKAGNKNFEIIKQSILDYKPDRFFDVVLALNIFHHFLKTKEDLNKLIALLGRMNMKTMFFEPHITTEQQMQGAYKNFEHDEFVQFILANSCLNSAEIIGKAEDGRVIYKLWQ